MFTSNNPTLPSALAFKVQTGKFQQEIILKILKSKIPHMKKTTKIRKKLWISEAEA